MSAQLSQAYSKGGFQQVKQIQTKIVKMALMEGISYLITTKEFLPDQFGKKKAVKFLKRPLRAFTSMNNLYRISKLRLATD
jgi:hypothetical protein